MNKCEFLAFEHSLLSILNVKMFNTHTLISWIIFSHHLLLAIIIMVTVLWLKCQINDNKACMCGGTVYDISGTFYIKHN